MVRSVTGVGYRGLVSGGFEGRRSCFVVRCGIFDAQIWRFGNESWVYSGSEEIDLRRYVRPQ